MECMAIKNSTKYEKSKTLNVTNLSLTLCTHLDANLKRYRLLYNRITRFERQLSTHFYELGYYPALAVKEITRLRKMFDTLHNKYHLNDLINNNINTQLIEKEINSWLKIKNHWYKATKLDWIQKQSSLNIIEEETLRQLEEASLSSRKHQIVFRLNLALEEAVHQGWYIIMNTLTVSSENYTKVWKHNSKAFRDYIQRFDRISGKKNHVYYAVVEHGSLHDREHLHVIHMLKDIKNDWKKDPNYSLIQPTRREIDGIKPLWQFGYSSPIAVRTSGTDAWGLIGYRWPLRRVGKLMVPEKSGSISRLANYLSKYITKAITTKESKKWKQRIRQQMGMTIINQTLDRLSTLQLNQMIEISHQQALQIHRKAIPKFLLLSATHRQILGRLSKSKRITQLITLKPLPSLMKRLTTMTQPSNIYNLLKPSFSHQKSLKSTEISNIQEVMDYNTLLITGFIDYPNENQLQGSSIERI